MNLVFWLGRTSTPRNRVFLRILRCYPQIWEKTRFLGPMRLGLIYWLHQSCTSTKSILGGGMA